MWDDIIIPLMENEEKVFYKYMSKRAHSSWKTKWEGGSQSSYHYGGKAHSKQLISLMA